MLHQIADGTFRGKFCCNIALLKPKIEGDGETLERPMSSSGL
jgi:hypothetical protein